VETGSLTQLSPDSVEAAWSPVWSPDGSTIAYSADGDVHTVAASDGFDRVVARGASYRGGDDWDCGGGGAQLTVSDWAPDGGQLLLTAFKFCYEYLRSDLAVVAPDGSGLRELVETGRDEEWPSYSPDGRTVAFSGVQTVDRDGRNLRRVGDGFMPAWSPAGAIAFTHGVYDAADQSGIVDFEVWAADPVPRRLNADPLQAGLPRWSTDGSVVGFLGTDAANRSLHAVAAEGGRAHRISPADAPDVTWFDFRPLPAEPTTASAARLAGADRYATAAAIASEVQRTRSVPSSVALLARGDAFPDGLTAAKLGAVPLLLTTRDTLHPAARWTLATLGVREVRIVGGVAAVSSTVETQLRDAGYTVTRISGDDRYSTAAATFDAARADRGIGTLNGQRTVLVASGRSFPDALAAGPVAADAHLPILLTEPDTLPSSTSGALDACTSECPEQAVIVGGTAVVASSVEAELRARGLQVRRVAGETRQGTAVAIAQLAVGELGWALGHVNLARGDTFPDALAAGPLGGAERAPTLLAANAVTVGADARTFLYDHAAGITSLHALGDATAVSTAALLEAQRASS